MKSLSLPLRLALALALASGCASPLSPEAGTGSIQVAVSVPQALSASDVTRIQVTVSASGMASFSVELAPSNGSWGGLIGHIPAGSDRSFLAKAYDASGTLRFQGQASGVTLSAGQTTAVALTLQEVAPPPPYANEAPLIDSLAASSTSVATGAPLSLTAAVHDPNPGDSLTVAWTASSGTFSTTTAPSTSWTAPATPGIQIVTLTVTDSQGASASISLALNVLPGASTGNAALSISFNLGPTVSKVSASQSRIDADQSTAVSATASDADGDTLSYQWTASCPGTWTNATSSAASFVPSSVPASACNNCQLTVTVKDGRGGQTTGSLALCIASASTPRFPPRVTNFYQSTLSASPGQTVTFDAAALDPQASPLTFTWLAATGSLGTPVHTASTSRITWTAPSCAAAGTAPGITATVTNAFNLSATLSFLVTGLPACVSGWASAGAMTSARYLHTATLLPGGKLLVSGGFHGGKYVASAEVYDPATDTWSATASMASPRGYHTATLLPNGKLLVSGGCVSSTSHLATAEVYDPATGTWSATSSMASPHGYHTATLLPNGKVLVSGGYNSNNYVATAEVYDPATGTWSATGSMVSPRGHHLATLLPNGKVLVSGGYSGSAYMASVEVYDPATGTWSATGSMTSPRGYHTATLLPNGKVLVSGGHHNNTPQATAEVYDPATGAWSATVSMASARYVHAATLLPNGKVLVSGGYHNGYVASAEVYDPATGTWITTASMVSPRGYHTAMLLPNGKVLVPGGYSGAPLAEAELYSP
ncbi:kelch repeat-containing protein [Stigmatella erecta]|uniref:Kelch motif-containing protein n=1 Tax=Stigmatella erecta TaxID=83460 RepID=A0A1I0L179_9BACT|nr:kelch repeat-containing protein [Stigmatella erecta]SEU31928.1 Kelch motif-containing protein [Stigmatella erecta]